ncbi:hypothetical protein [Nocardioides stalactiti]|uniref:hypothetical protein n=1 Tax=Nocardioides stalactiti TaxID=2755356 RepID=UPI0015FECD2E|nr:hypothetical protein [Nocardioides stalactiti]
MSWESDLFAVFEDLEGQADYQTVTLASRLMGSAGTEVTLGVLGVGPLTGTVDRVAAEWLLVSSGKHDWVVSVDAITTVERASVRAVAEETWSPLTRLGLGSALRRIAEAGERCRLHLRDGSHHEGTLRRIGADFCELVEGDDRRMILVPFTALSAAQSRA